MKKNQILLQLKTIPKSPGVYVFKAKTGRIIYIGKAANLKNRVSQYFQKGDRLGSPAKYSMVKNTAKIDYQETESEIEALILEANLIKKHKPRYNVVLRDDKNYGFAIVTKENFPRLIITHQPSKIKNISKTIGPFTNVKSLKQTLRVLRRIFPFCSCKKLHKNICLYHRLDLCPGYCCIVEKNEVATKQDIGNYKNNIKNIVKFLFGKKRTLVNDLKKQMTLAAKKQEFEKASQFRDQINYLEKVIAHKKVIEENPEIGLRNIELLKIVDILKLPQVPQRIEGYDISNIQGTSATGSMVVFENFEPAKNEYRKFRIFGLNTPNDTAMLQEVIRRRLNHTEWPMPDLFLIDGGQGQLNAVLEVLIKNNIKIPAVSLAKQEEELYSPALINPLPLKSLPQSIQFTFQRIRDQAHRFAITYHRKLRSKRMKM